MSLLNHKLGAAALVVGVACLRLADPAFAGTDIKVHTTDTSPGGTAIFKSKGDKLIVCDVPQRTAPRRREPQASWRGHTGRERAGRASATTNGHDRGGAPGQ
jgi:hypothetical protein